MSPAIVSRTARMERFRQWLKAGLRKSGKSGRGLAEHLGLNPAAVSRILSGERQIKADELERIAEYLGEPPPPLGRFSTYRVRVIGVAAIGIWREAGAMVGPTEHEIPVINDSSKLEKYALQIADASISNVIPKGGFAICVPYFSERTELLDGDLVHVERTKGNLIESTIKRLRKNASHKFELWPDGAEPSARPIPLSEDLEIKGLVVGLYMPL